MVLAGCATKDLNRPPFAPEAVGAYSSNIYLYNVYDITAGTDLPPIYLNDEKVATMQYHSYVMFKVAPGLHGISIRSPGINLALDVNTEAGQNYFLKFSQSVGGVGLMIEHKFQLGQVTETYALEELRFLDPAKDLLLKHRKQECARLKEHDAERPIYCRPLVDLQTDASGNSVGSQLNVTGTYLSEITTTNQWHFKKPYQHLKIKLVQTGNEIAATEPDFDTKIYPELKDGVIVFELAPGKVNGFTGIKGEWKIDPETAILEGSWRGGGGNGNWNILRIE